jgi:hypothetical protein
VAGLADQRAALHRVAARARWRFAAGDREVAVVEEVVEADRARARRRRRAGRGPEREGHADRERQVGGTARHQYAPVMVSRRLL